MTKQLLGFFDSGLGGLTVLRRVLERHGPVPCVSTSVTRPGFPMATVNRMRSGASPQKWWVGCVTNRSPRW